MNAKELKVIQEESYDKWFERWYEKENLPKKLEESAMKGYTAYSYVINNKNHSDYTCRRMNDNRFIKKLGKKLNGFDIYRNNPQRYTRTMFGKNLGYGWTDPEIVISWKGK